MVGLPYIYALLIKQTDCKAHYHYSRHSPAYADFFLLQTVLLLKVQCSK